MKRKVLSVLLSVMLVIATICVSNMPSRAVEPDDEMTQDEMVTAEVLSNSEVTATGELTEEVTEMTTEELTEETIERNEKASENITSTATDAAEFDADTETAGDFQNDEMSVENSNEDMMLTDEEETEEVQEEITEEMLEGAEVEKLENVLIWSGEYYSIREKEYRIVTIVSNHSEFDIYLSCLRGYVTDEKGNEYNVPVSVTKANVGANDVGTESIDITNETKGYIGYNNESVLTDESVLVSSETEKWYLFSYTVPVELEGNYAVHIYAEFVRLDNISSKVVALCSHSGTYFKYNHVINMENSNYDIWERGDGELNNIDIGVYHDGNYLIDGAETNFYIQISNNNDFDIQLAEIKFSYGAEDFGDIDITKPMNWDEYFDFIGGKNLQIIDSNGKNILHYYGDYYRAYYIGYDSGYSSSPEVISIKAGETVTYRVHYTLSSDDSGKVRPIEFLIQLRGNELDHPFRISSYDYRCDFKPLDYSPTVSIDKEDENVPNMKLDSDAYEALVNSAFTELEIKSGKHLKVDLIIATVAEASIAQNDLEAIKAAAKKRKIAVILDMNLVKLIDGIISGNVNELDKEITMTIDVPKAFQAENRKFSIIRLHDGIAEELPDLDDNPNTVTFSTGKFSLYALIYEDAEGITTEPSKSDASETIITPVKDADKTQQTASPNTGDGIPVAALLAIMFMIIFLAVICIKRIKKDNT